MSTICLTPKETSEAFIVSAQHKISTTAIKRLLMSVIAGMYISLGAQGFIVTYDNLFIRAAVFPVGLMLIVLVGGELFTGDCLMTFGYLDKKIPLKGYVKTLAQVFMGNLAGALAVVALLYFGGVYNNPVLSETVVKIAHAKLSLSFLEALSRGILCNILVSLGVWFAATAKPASEYAVDFHFIRRSVFAAGNDTNGSVCYYYSYSNHSIKRDCENSNRKVFSAGLLENMNKKQTMDFIHQTERQKNAPGLAPMERLLTLLGNPERGLKYIHIAGTNGKGSVASMLASIFHEAGYRTGLYTSPYIHTFNERIQIDGRNISDEALIEAAETVKRAVERMDEMPTEFDKVTAIAFLCFKKCGCDIVILETGLGGRLDSTNVIKSKEVAVITSIGLDHTKELGDTVEKIAAEKAGIIKHTNDVVLYPQPEAVYLVIESFCHKDNANLYCAEPGRMEILRSDLKCQSLSYKRFKNIEINLLGRYQLDNAATVLETIDVLIQRGWSIPEKCVRGGLKKARWPGRFELLYDQPVFILDGAHNPQGVKSLTDNISTYLDQRKVIFLAGVLKDKDYNNMFDAIMPFAKVIIAVGPEHPRAVRSGDLAEFLRCRYKLAGVYEAEDINCGIVKALDLAKAGDVIIAFGSLYMAGAVRAFFTAN